MRYFPSLLRERSIGRLEGVKASKYECPERSARFEEKGMNKKY